jgi:anti-sigma factor RsiW
MHRAGLSPGVGEDDLHAMVDGQLAADRHGEVMTHLAAHPDAAGRVAAFFEQRVRLAALGEALIDGEPEPRLAGMAEALGRVVREQRRVRRALRGGGLLILLVAALVILGLCVPRSTTHDPTS